MIDTSRPWALAFLLVAGLLAGAINAVAGGGSLLVFPALLAVGFPPLAANVTNSVAQWPGYVGQVIGNRRELPGQGRRILLTSIVAVLGAGVGAGLLLVLPGAGLRRDRARPGHPGQRHDGDRAAGSSARSGTRRTPSGTGRCRCSSAMFLAAVYGGYFGGALGVILISTLSLFAHDELRRLNALKGVLSVVVASVTVVVFAISAPVDWLAVALLAPTTLVGGLLGAQVARRMPENALRWAVVLLGLAVGVYLFFA